MKEGEDRPDRKKGAARLHKLGFVLSGVYLILISIWGYLQPTPLLQLEPNELGDLLAGIFAPLAFLWLVLGFLQQGQELRASVDALELQGRELQASVEQQRELVAVQREQHQAGLSAALSEAASRENLAQPRFSLSVTQVTQGGKPVSALVDIVSQVSDVNGVKAGLLGEDIRALPLLEKGKTMRIGIGFDKLDCGSDIEGHIQYFDAKGDLRGRSFLIERSEDGIGVITGERFLEGEALQPPFPWH